MIIAITTPCAGSSICCTVAWDANNAAAFPPLRPNTLYDVPLNQMKPMHTFVVDYTFYARECTLPAEWLVISTHSRHALTTLLISRLTEIRKLAAPVVH